MNPVSSFAVVTVTRFFSERLKGDPSKLRCEAFCKRTDTPWQTQIVFYWIEPEVDAWNASLMQQAQKQGFPVRVTFHENQQKFLILDTVKPVEPHAVSA